MGKPKTKTRPAASKSSRAKTTTKRAAKKKTKAKPKKKKNADKLKLTQEIVDEAAKIVGNGNFRYVARGRLEVPEGTWKSWLSYGRRDLREMESKGGKMSLQAQLVIALDKAESVVLSEIIRDVMTLGNDPASVKIKLEYAYRRYGKLFSKSPNAHDDDTGETVRVDPLSLLAEKLGPYLEGE